jgi:trimethylamine-N-oxide reductase (cytochrome c)
MPKQIIPKTLVHDAILKGHFSIMGSANQMWPAEDQFIRYEYPIPKEEGGSEIHMMWSDSGCYTPCWNDSNSRIKAWRSPKIEFIISEHPWLEGDSIFADLILPVTTKYEDDDIGDDSISNHFDTVFLQEKCIEPLGESKSDYEIACLVAEKLGVLEEYTKGKSVEEWKKHGFDTSGIKDMISWEKFKENKYYIVPTDPKWETYPGGCTNFTRTLKSIP